MRCCSSTASGADGRMQKGEVDLVAYHLDAGYSATELHESVDSGASEVGDLQ